MATGFLNLDKPAGHSSHDCVSRVRRALKQRQVGHGGTLDPAATGVLPIAVGRATRFLQYLPSQKRYRATFQLGRESTTDDAEGEIVRTTSAIALSCTEVESALTQFSGTISQVPPIYSAIKKQGKRLYELAREGVRPEDIDIPPRTVDIQQVDLLDWRAGEVAEVDLDITCGAGTYIRAIARDLGRTLGVGGLMSTLRRSQSGAFLEADSIPLEDFLASEHPEKALNPIESALTELPAIHLEADIARRWCCGQTIAIAELNSASRPKENENLTRVLGEGNRFLGLGRWESDRLMPERVLASQG